MHCGVWNDPMAQVISIHRVAEKNGPAEALKQVDVRADFGLEGDWRSKKNSGRQITLIEEEELANLALALKVPAIASGASRRQIVARGLRLNDTVGKKLRLGPLVLQVERLCDPCKNMEIMIGPGAWWAMKDRGGICARVLEGGVLKVGDALEVIEA